MSKRKMKVKAKCYYCDKVLTEKTIKKHVKTCKEISKVVQEELNENNETRLQYIISMKGKYNHDYCIYISIDANL